MRRAAKRDDNEPLIVRAIQSAGWAVFRVSDTGLPDLLCAKDGRLVPLEVKAPDGDLTPAQRETFTAFATAGVLVQVVRSPLEALEVLGCPYAMYRWYAANGAFMCESCWLPEDGLHDKKCPQRTKLKPKPAVQSAHRAAKKVEEAMPKKVPFRVWSGPLETATVVHEGEMDEAEAVRLGLVDICECGHPHGNHAGTYGSGACSKCGERRCDAFRSFAYQGQTESLHVVNGELQPLKVKR